MMMNFALILATAISVASSTKYARMELIPANGSGVVGGVSFTQEEGSNNVQVCGEIFGLAPGEHGFHIHQEGATTNNCKDAKGHFNPFNQNHGAPEDKVRHVGDLGNIMTESNAEATQICFSDNVISLDENSDTYIVGRAVVVHQLRDDLGKGGDKESLITGNAGARLACGVIVKDKVNVF